MFTEKIKRLRILFHFDNWLQLLINRMFWPNGGPVVYKLDGLEIFIDHSAGDQDGTRSCLVPGLYAPCMKELTDLPAKINVLDLGANGGGFLLFLHHLGIRLNRAVLVELNPHTWSRCVLNVYKNIPAAPRHTVILNGAAGKSDDRISVRLGYGSVSDSILREDSDGEHHEILQYSFASLLTQFEKNCDIDLCKIDIEGAEYDLLRNVSHDDLRRCRNIIIEIHEVTGESSDALEQKIIGSGYRRRITRDEMIENNVFVYSRVD